VKRFILSLFAVGCAHAPVPVRDVELPGSGGPELRVFREMVREELLAAYRPANELTLYLKLNGEPVYLGTIDYTGTSKTNHEATTPFANTGDELCGKVLLLQPSTEVYVGRATTSTGTVTAVNGVKLQPNERVVWMPPVGTDCFIAALRVSASGDLKFWELK